jgi:tripartite-type tricarboxylate transporter receptor subunit TctC
MKLQIACAWRGFTELATAILIIVAMGIAPAVAQDYPTQPIRIVVPYPPAGSTDFIARHFANFLSKELGQTVLIENRAGASTNIGADAVVQAKPDGYTLLFGSSGQVLNPIFGPRPLFNLMNSLDPVSLVARVPFIVAANKNAPFSTPKELIAAAKAAPGKFSVSSAQLDLYVELLKNRAGINLLHVPYKGGGPATTDAISGQVDMVFALVPVILPHVQGGRLKAIGVSSAQRIASLPEVPTFAESGVGYDISTWYGLLAPAGTPKSVVNRLFTATQKIVADPDFVAKLRPSGVTAVSNRPEEFHALLVGEIAFWQQVAKDMPNLVSPDMKK